MQPALRVHGATHPGNVHPKNEDSHAIVPQPDGSTLLVVCDGMGGMGRGDQASQMAIDVIRRTYELTPGDVEMRIRTAIATADVKIREALCSTGQGWAGSTAAIAVVRHGRAHVAWVGDSRVYLLRDGAVVERTRDHKLVQELVDSGQLTAEEAKRSSLSSVITRALGGRPPSAPPVAMSALETPWTLEVKDRILLCSDGLTDLVTDAELPSILAGPDLDQACDALVQTALSRGGHDNITVVLGGWDDDESLESTQRVQPVRRSRLRPDPVLVSLFIAAVALLSYLAVQYARSRGT
jgi:protein phosphatase